MDKLTELIIMLFREPKYQPLRYLGVGAWNTVFGAFVYAALHYFFNTRIHYLLLIIPANILAITNAFLCYKYIVFQTEGKGWHEYFKCYLVYGWIALLNAGFLYALVTFAHLHPSIANCFCILTATTISYLSHKHFSFRGRK
jgi:putative flippase GtrA